MIDRTSAGRPGMQEQALAAAHLVIAFVAGFIAVLLFHQSVLAIFAAIGVVSATAYSSEPAAVTGLPQVLSRALLGGVYGVVLMELLERVVRPRAAATFWIAALGLGALLPSIFAWFILAPIKGRPLAAGGDPNQIVVALVTNAVWGIGTVAIYSAIRRVWRG